MKSFLKYWNHHRFLAGVVGVLILIGYVLAGCGGKQAIIVDTEGLPSEQKELIEWKVKYAVGLDWYDYQLRSYKAALDAMPPADAKKVYKDLEPFFETTRASLDSFGLYVKGMDPDADPNQLYNDYLRIRAVLLAKILDLIND